MCFKTGKTCWVENPSEYSGQKIIGWEPCLADIPSLSPTSFFGPLDGFSSENKSRVSTLGLKYTPQPSSLATADWEVHPGSFFYHAVPKLLLPVLGRPSATQNVDELQGQLAHPCRFDSR